MKIIHCADLHLDSKLSANLDRDKAAERKMEIINAYKRMIDYAENNNVDCIIIAGDLFDTKNVTKRTRNVVLDSMYSHENIDFYYLQGNHDLCNWLDGVDDLPSNLHLFSESWRSYECNGVTINGVELTDENAASIYNTLLLDNDKYNIVVMHGQESSATVNKADNINLKELRNKGIDYLALGHIHAYKEEKLDNRGVYCYPGCLEGRGFDECGEHGFVLLDIDEQTNKCDRSFIVTSYRNLYEVLVDITGCMTTDTIANKIRYKLKEEAYESKHLIKIVLTGEVDIECDIDMGTLLAEFKDEFYFLKIYNHSVIKIDYNDYAKDESLKGEFVRMIMNADDIKEEDKPFVIKYGIMLLSGEEV